MSQDVTGAEIADMIDLDVIVLNDLDREYLSALNTEVIYAQKAYLMALSHIRRVYDVPENEWALNNINKGFERVTQ